MDRRHFITLTGLAAVAPGSFSRALLADPREPSARRSKLKLPFLKQLLSTPQTGFPTVTPQFAAMFTPGTGGIQMVRSETLNDFYAQIQAQAGNGYVLSAMTTIQNLNRIWYYGAFKKGTGSFQFINTTDPNAFQQVPERLHAGGLQYFLAKRRGELHGLLAGER
jgi:hypothetical protein